MSDGSTDAKWKWDRIVAKQTRVTSSYTNYKAHNGRANGMGG